MFELINNSKIHSSYRSPSGKLIFAGISDWIGSLHSPHSIKKNVYYFNQSLVPYLYTHCPFLERKLHLKMDKLLFNKSCCAEIQQFCANCNPQRVQQTYIASIFKTESHRYLIISHIKTEQLKSAGMILQSAISLLRLYA